MTKKILTLAAVLGFVAQTSVFAADANPTPSPAESATPAAPHHKHHKHHKATTSPAATPAAKPTATPS